MIKPGAQRYVIGIYWYKFKYCSDDSIHEMYWDIPFYIHTGGLMYLPGHPMDHRANSSFPVENEFHAKSSRKS